MSPELQKANKHLEELEIFLASHTHVSYQACRDAEIEILKEQILNLRPTTPDNIAMQLQAFGEMDSQIEMKNTFRNARDTLKERISEMTERENEAATTTKI